jgi:hypothetical protein
VRYVAAAVCLSNAGCDDLEPRKLYRLLPDRQAAAHGFVRVVDESGEDYLDLQRQFAVVKLPAAVAQELLGAS